jgi:hypothetical protein
LKIYNASRRGLRIDGAAKPLYLHLELSSAAALLLRVVLSGTAAVYDVALSSAVVAAIIATSINQSIKGTGARSCWLFLLRCLFVVPAFYAQAS